MKPGFFSNEHLGQCSFPARLLFEAFWCLADCNGRLEYRPLRIKAFAFPYDAVDDIPNWIGGLTDELERQQEIDGTPALVERYEVNGSWYLQVIHFLSHESPHPKEPARWPANPRGYAESLTSQEKTGGVADISKREEVRGKRLEGESEGEGPHQFPASSPDLLPVGALQQEGLEQVRKIRQEYDSRPRGRKP